jgi:hypothetical protein
LIEHFERLAGSDRAEHQLQPEWRPIVAHAGHVRTFCSCGLDVLSRKRPIAKAGGSQLWQNRALRRRSRDLPHLATRVWPSGRHNTARGTPADGGRRAETWKVRWRRVKIAPSFGCLTPSRSCTRCTPARLAIARIVRVVLSPDVTGSQAVSQGRQLPVVTSASSAARL